MKIYITVLLFTVSLNTYADSSTREQHSKGVRNVHEAKSNNPLLEGPCARKSMHAELIPRLREKEIPFVIHDIKGTPFICYNSEYSERVDKISDEIYGTSPGPNSINLGRDAEMDSFEAKLIELGIPYVRSQYYGKGYIGWENENDENVKEILRDSFNTDLDEIHKNAVYQ